MNVSVASVSRALTKARELGIVRISIQSDPDDFAQLEIELEQAFGLRECLLVPSSEQIDTCTRRWREPGRILGGSKEDTLGLSWKPSGRQRQHARGADS
jgi:DNA-binding transcriptional regulator LsrR (DeoR family)